MAFSSALAYPHAAGEAYYSLATSASIAILFPVGDPGLAGDPFSFASRFIFCSGLETDLMVSTSGLSVYELSEPTTVSGLQIQDTVDY